MVLVRAHDVVVRDTLRRGVSYVNLSEYCFGSRVGGFVYFVIVATTLGTNGAYMMFIASILQSIWYVLHSVNLSMTT